MIDFTVSVTAAEERRLSEFVGARRETSSNKRVRIFPETRAIPGEKNAPTR